SQENAYAILKTLVLDIGPRPMGSPAEQRAMGFAVSKFNEYGCDTSYVMPMTVASNVNTNSGVAIGVKKGKSERIIVIGGHIDTTPNAPGANDDGSGTACVIELARVLCKRENESTVLFCCWGGEEQGLRGSEYFVKNLPLSFGHAYGMNEGGVGVRDLFGPGKFFLLNLWEKGPLWLKLSASGRAGHGSRPSDRDAPARLARAMARVAEHRSPAKMTDPVREMLRVLFAQGRIDLDPDALTGGPEDAAALEAFAKRYPETDPLLRNTFAITTLSAGFKPNVIPMRAEGTIDCRILPGEDPSQVEAQVREMVREFDVAVEAVFSEKPSGSPRGPLFDAMEEAIRTVHPDAVVLPYMSTGFTDSRFFRAAGVETYGLMPLLLERGDVGRIHGVDEKIPVDGIAEMTAVIAALIERWNAPEGIR
ncbi:MAG: M20 dimer protein, partial [Actinobacteria bacterium]|nr:M20 dimer protein [Actinomycetota bacterium]